MSFRVRFTSEAKSDLERLYGFLVTYGIGAAQRALEVIEKAWIQLEEFPFSCRKVEGINNPLIRELFIPFGSAGSVALFEIESKHTVTVVAVRHQREDDYY